MKLEIMVVKNEHLFSQYKRETKFYPGKEYEFEKIILENHIYMERGIAETHFDYKQPIPYAVVVNEKNEIFVYKRGGKGSNNGENRILDKVSIGVGGHLEEESGDIQNPLTDGLLREIEEEINIGGENIVSVKPIGYLNNEDDEMNQVHFGVAYIVKVNNTEIQLLDGELEKGEFMNISQLDQLQDNISVDMEYWTQLLIEPLKEYLVK